jgi:archaeal flagellar protein FlaI
MVESGFGNCFYSVDREGQSVVLNVDCNSYLKIPSLEEDSILMSHVSDQLIKNKNVTKIRFSQKRDYEYSSEETEILKEVAFFYNDLSRKPDLFSLKSYEGRAHLASVQRWLIEIKNIVIVQLKSDPLGTFVHLKHLHRQMKIAYERSLTKDEEEELNKIMSFVGNLITEMQELKIINLTKEYLPGHKEGDRAIYKRVFNPIIKPDFLFSKLMALYPKQGIEKDNYSVSDNEVVIFEIPNNVQQMYHVLPPEFKLNEDEYEILDLARKIMSEHKPKEQEFVDPERMREVFFSVGRDLIMDLASYKEITLKKEQVEDLTKILVRYTVGFGLVEVLLEDPKIQDVAINAPYGSAPIYIVHEDFDECMTNIIPTEADVESWASKLRMISGRSLDEANPILDTEILIPKVASARVSVVTQPLSPAGLSFSFRRQRDKPWTFPLFIKNKMMSPLSAGLLSFFIDGNRTLMVAGTRGSGKTSFLGSILIEMMRKFRIITIEDTLELPTNALRKLGYDVVALQVAAALSKDSTEFTATQGIRSTLRLGDSALFVGEVRSKEAIALFEAMRVGAGANVVGGTFHADSAFGIYDRCVNAIGIANNSFKALDLAIIVNPIKSADGLHRWRRITKITEVRKDWKEDPLLEHGFVDLMVYSSETDQLEPTDALLNGDCELIKGIAGNIKEWAGDWDAVWENIILRSNTKEHIVKVAEQEKLPIILESEFIVLANDEFHKIINKVRESGKNIDSDKVLTLWKSWLDKEVHKLKMKSDD